MLVQEPIQKIQMFRESFSPTEAREIIASMIDPYLKHYRLQFMRLWEADHEFDSHEIDRKIKRLKSLKKELEESIRQADAHGSRVKIESFLDLRVSK